MTQPAQQQNPQLLLAAPLYTGLDLRLELDTALKPLLTRVRKLFLIDGVPVTDGQRAQMALNMFRVMRNARTRSYVAATRYLHGQGVVEIPPMREYRIDAVEKMLADAKPASVAGEPVNESNRTTPHIVTQAAKSAARAAARHAQQPARETVQEVADESGEEIGWARVLVGARSCGFCAMLASRGPVYSSDKTAMFRGGASIDTYHNGCDCIPVLVRRGVPWEGEDAYHSLNKLWQDTGAKASGRRAMNTFRREWDQKVRSGETGEFISDSMKPPGGVQ